MRIGLMAGATAATGNSLKDIVEFSKAAEQLLYGSHWGFSHIAYKAVLLIDQNYFWNYRFTG